MGVPITRSFAGSWSCGWWLIRKIKTPSDTWEFLLRLPHVLFLFVFKRAARPGIQILFRFFDRGSLFCQRCHSLASWFLGKSTWEGVDGQVIRVIHDYKDLSLGSFTKGQLGFTTQVASLITPTQKMCGFFFTICTRRMTYKKHGKKKLYSARPKKHPRSIQQFCGPVTGRHDPNRNQIIPSVQSSRWHKS